MAQRFLERQGLVILGRNVRTPGGELDIVAQDGPTVIFVEVRSRRSRTFGRPQESITAAKRRHLLESAQWFLQERGLDNAPWRVDLITLELMPEGQGPYLEHIPNAVQG
ncbi:MAG: YraN family protein [Chloroflexi bacterium]|nr:YraN family protein [Chloroflexota bacterium]